MGIPPVKLPTKSTSATADDEFRPIKLSGTPILSNGGVAGVTFESCDQLHHDHNSCLCKYSIANTRHSSVAGLTRDGCLLFCVKCWINGCSTTAMGAFDPQGKPMPITPRYKDILLKYVPEAPNLVISDGTISNGKVIEVGVRTTTNPNFGVYTNAAKDNLIFKLNGKIDTSPNLAYKANAIFAPRKSMDLVGGGLNFSGTQGPWTGTADAKFTKGAKPAFQFDATRRFNLSGQPSTLTVSVLPNKKPSMALPKLGEEFKFDDPSQVKLTLKISF